MMALPWLNGWRRLWVVIAVVGLVWAVLYARYLSSKTYYQWDGEVVAALENPKCAHLRAEGPHLPEGFEWEEEPGDPCYALARENRYAGRTLHNKGEYEALVKERFDQGLTGMMKFMLAVWAGFAVFLYAVGATVAWVRRGFRTKPQ